MKYDGKEYEEVEGTCTKCALFKYPQHIAPCTNCKLCLRMWREVKPTTEQSSEVQTFEPNEQLHVIATDKTRKEQAEREIVQILERLNGQLEMRIAGVVVDIHTASTIGQPNKEMTAYTVEILLK